MPETHLSKKQLRRQEAIGLATLALAAESAGTIFNRGSSKTPPPANGLIAVAHFITTGGRDYLPDEMTDPVVEAAADEDPQSPEGCSA